MSGPVTRRAARTTTVMVPSQAVVTDTSAASTAPVESSVAG
ncbi:MAG: hypothetical protein R2726_12390 [Acidimicrobiales bacterium]